MGNKVTRTAIGIRIPKRMIAQFALYLRKKNVPSTTKSYIIRYVLADFSRALEASGISVPSEEETELILAGIQMVDAENTLFPELRLQIEGATVEDRMRSTLELLDSLGEIT